MNKEQIQIIVLMVFVIAGVYVGTILMLIIPAADSKKNLDTQLETVIQDIKAKKGTASKLESATKELEVAEEKINKYNKNIITPSEFDFFKDTLRDIGKEHNVDISRDLTNVMIGDKKTVFKQDPLYVEKEIVLKITCGYHDFGEFISRIEKTTPFRKIISFSILKTKSRKKNKNLLNINLKILSLMKDNTI